MTIGTRISTLRKQMKYSQEYVAEQLGVSRQAVSKWEKDISKPDTDNVIRLAELLNTNVEYILTGNVISHTEDNIKKKKSPKEKKKNSCLDIFRHRIYTCSQYSSLHSSLPR